MAVRITTLAALFFAVCLLLPAAAAAQSDPSARIVIPTRGQTVFGNVTIQGTASTGQLARFEVAYAAEPDLASWTVIGGAAQPVENNVLAVWNTRPVPDGAYALRVQVFNADGSVQEGLVRDITVANQPAEGAASPSPSGAGDTADESGGDETAADSLESFDLADIPAAFLRGARIALLALLAFGAYLILKRIAGFLWRRLFARPIDYGR
jgi:hypothetical protein